MRQIQSINVPECHTSLPLIIPAGTHTNQVYENLQPVTFTMEVLSFHFFQRHAAPAGKIQFDPISELRVRGIVHIVHIDPRLAAVRPVVRGEDHSVSARAGHAAADENAFL